MGRRTFRGNDVAIFGDDKSRVMAGQPEPHKAVDQANANDAANGIPVDPGLDPRFATHRAAQQLLDSNTPDSWTSPLEDLDWRRPRRLGRICLGVWFGFGFGFDPLKRRDAH